MKTNRTVIALFLAALTAFVVIPSLFSPKLTSAATPAQWKNKSTITYDGSDYIDNKTTDDDHQFHKDGNDDSKKCVDVVRDFNNTDITKATQAHLVTWRSFSPSFNAVGSAYCIEKDSKTIDIDQATLANATKASATGNKDNSCESKGGPMAWVMCPVIRILDGIFNWLDTQIQALLEVNRDAYTDSKLYKAWSNIRNIAYLILIPIMLVMVIGTALGIEAMNAYTVKKALPRMVAAIFFISLSWYICGFFINLFNVIGSGVLGLMTSPFGLNGQVTLAKLFEPSYGGAALGVTAAGGIAAALLLIAFGNGVIGLVLLYFLAAVGFIFVAFLVLVVRQMFILGLILAAPLAILVWIFPGNDKLWKLWWGTFSKLLIMYPLVMGLIGIGRVFAYLVGNTPSAGLQGGLLNPLLKITAYIIPYLVIPLTFKFAGGAFATLTGMVNDRSRGIFDRMKKGRQNKAKQIAHNAKYGNFVRGRSGGWLDRNINERVQGISMLGKAGFNPLNWSAGIESARQDRDKEERKAIMEDPEFANSENYDNIQRAILRGENRAGIRAELVRQDQERMDQARAGARATALARGASEAEADAAGDRAAEEISRYRDPASLDRDVARAERIRRKFSTRALRQVAALQMEKGGTAENSGGESLRMLVDAAGGDDAVLMNLVAEWRSAAMAGGQVTHGGGSQGAVYGIARRVAAGDISAEEADELLVQAAIETQGVGVLSHPQMKAHDADRIMSGLQTRLAGAVSSGSMDAVDREMALINGIQSALPQAAPQFVDRFAREVMQAQISTDSLSDEQLTGLDDIVIERRMVQPGRTEHVQVRDAAGNFTGRTEVVEIPPVYEDVGARENVTVQQVHNARRGSAVYNAHTKDWGQQEAAARAGGAPRGPGAPVVPPPVAPVGGP